MPDTKAVANASSAIDRLRQRAQALKREVLALRIAARHPRTPRMARVIIGFVAAYALSPIDLIPDFIPVLGLLDDLIIVPLGVTLALRMIPKDVMHECRIQAAKEDRHASLLGLGLVVLVWLLGIALAGWSFLRLRK